MVCKDFLGGVVGRAGTTEYLQTVGTQCATGTLVQTGGVAQFGGEVVQTPVVTPTPAVSTMNHQLGTVYATKRRRRNGKRYCHLSSHLPPKTSPQL